MTTRPQPPAGEMLTGATDGPPQVTPSVETSEERDDDTIRTE
jgi:hypothetical protein